MRRISRGKALQIAGRTLERAERERSLLSWRDIVAEAEAEAESARDELLAKDHTTIEKETAEKWLSRAIAAYTLSRESDTPEEGLRWFSDAEDYGREAIEHAGGSEDNDLLERVRKGVKAARDKVARKT